MILADKVVNARKRQAITQEELAERSGITLRTIQGIEKAQTIPRSHTIKAIAAALCVPLSDFVGTEALTSASQAMNSFDEDNSGSNFKLQLLNLSALSGLIVPFANVIVPLMIWNKNKSDEQLYAVGKSIVTYQILWTVTISVLMLIITLSQILAARYFGMLPGPWLVMAAIIMNLLNAALIIRATVRLHRGKRNLYPVNLLADARQNS